jgi:putative endonuclease
MSAHDHRQLGRQGEAHVRRYLEARGLRFRAANWRCAAGELDLIMIDGDEVVFVEVKTRFGDRLGRAEETVSMAQASRILAAAEWYMDGDMELRDRVWRIDLVGLTLGSRGEVACVVHIPNGIVAG